MSMMDDDIGTVRWFGESWGAPINDPRAEVPVPLTDLCEACRDSFNAASQGIQMPYVGREAPASYHLTCWLRSIGVQVTQEVLETEDGAEP